MNRKIFIWFISLAFITFSLSCYSQTTKKKGEKKHANTTQGIKKKKKKSKIAAVAVPPAPAREQAPVPPTPVVPVDSMTPILPTNQEENIVFIRCKCSETINYYLSSDSNNWNQMTISDDGRPKQHKITENLILKL